MVVSPHSDPWPSFKYGERWWLHCSSNLEEAISWPPVRSIAPVAMEKILERYDRYSYAEKQLAATDTATQESWSFEYTKLTARVEVLQRNIRNYVGEELDPLNLRDLQSLEQQLDTAIKRIRARKNQLLHETVSELHKKVISSSYGNIFLFSLDEHVDVYAELTHMAVLWQEKALAEQNSLLAKKATREEDGAQARPGSNSLMPSWMLPRVNWC
ncbi:hypothetical protein RJ639_036775 [Escallonia herrerae]|uniref:K-box domain-containing protein n=1 Tax=Escallonia herrerae TaxID=1293975 RepID=A0AA89BI02_9ASTE|nr:hypothetical protein RJ639_036775 [Escallonia herrerae]